MISHLLNRSLNVHRPTSTTDAVGGQVVSFVQMGSVKASVSQPTPEERRAASQEGVHLTHVIHVGPTDDVRRGDELRESNGARFRVVSWVLNSRSTYRRLSCETTQSEGA